MENDLFQQMQQDAMDRQSAVESTDTERLSDVSALASKIIQTENKVKFLLLPSSIDNEPVMLISLLVAYIEPVC